MTVRGLYAGIAVALAGYVVGSAAVLWRQGR